MNQQAVRYDDTIAAIATASGAGAIGIVRISGSQACAILDQIARPMRAGAWRPWQMRYAHVFDQAGNVIDEVLVCYMRGPRSYTGEDVVEVSCHGGRVALELILQRVLACGARAADPGEFTMRAFMAGRIDLSQAEAVMDVIQAQTAVALNVAQSQLRGELGQTVQRIRSAIIYELAAVVARIDFPDEVDETAVNHEALREVLTQLQQLLAQSRAGMMVRDGATVVLLGKPNVGKSSLLNALLRQERALVSPIAGTTRDTLAEYADVLGVPVRFVDTAGISDDTHDIVEQMGIARSRQMAHEADLALILIDSSQPLDERDMAAIQARGELPALLLLTKSDLPGHQPTLEQAPLSRAQAFLAIQAISTQTGQGLTALQQQLRDCLIAHQSLHDIRVSNARHIESLRRCAESLADALAGLQQRVSADLIAVDLQSAVAALGEITGEEVSESILDTVFARFCIGK